MDSLELALNATIVALGVGMILGAVGVLLWAKWVEAKQQVERWLP